MSYKTQMKKIINVGILILFLLFIFCHTEQETDMEVSELTNKIAFLKNGEVWITNEDGHKMKQLTNTNKKIQDFLFSPTLRYLAYSKIIKYVDEPGLWEEGEEIPKKAVCSIVIIDLKNQNTVKEIMPQEGNWVYPAKWLPEEKFLYYGASGFDVWGFFEYDVQTNIEKELDYQKGNQLSEADFLRDGSFMVYVDESRDKETFRSNLHIVDLKTTTDKILISKKSILEPKISDDKNHVSAKEQWIELILAEATLVCSDYVLIETLALIQHRIGLAAVRVFQEDIFPLLNIEWVDESTYRSGVASVLTAARRDLSLVDCISFEVMRRLGIHSVFAFDNHFREQAFACLP